MVDALKREVKEETGLTINEYKLVYVSPLFENHQFLKPFLNIGYLCFVDNCDVIISNEHLDYKWINVEELESFLDNDIFNDLNANGIIKQLQIMNKGKYYEQKEYLNVDKAEFYDLNVIIDKTIECIT